MSPASHPCATKNKERASSAVLYDRVKKRTPHTSWTHTQTYKDTTHPPETCRPLGSLPFTQKPLWKVVQSNTNTFSLVSEEALCSEKWLSQSVQRSTALDGEKQRSWGQNNKYANEMIPQGCIFTIWEKRLCFSTRMNRKDVEFFPAYMTSFTERITHLFLFFFFLNLVSWFLLLSFFASSSRCDTMEEMKRMKDISTSLLW